MQLADYDENCMPATPIRRAGSNAAHNKGAVSGSCFLQRHQGAKQLHHRQPHVFTGRRKVSLLSPAARYAVRCPSPSTRYGPHAAACLLLLKGCKWVVYEWLWRRLHTRRPPPVSLQA